MKVARRWYRAAGVTGLASVVILGLIVMGAVAGPYIWPTDPLQINLLIKFAGPSLDHPFGTDSYGRDILSRLLVGARISLLGATAVLIGSTSVGLLVGGFAGLIGGRIDAFLSRIVDALLSLPSLIIALGIVGSIGTSFTNLVLALVLTGWPWYARLYRGMVISQRAFDYVSSARVIGCSTWRIAWRHVGPNIAGPVIVVAATSLGNAILGLASLSFLGLGTQPPNPEWGVMVSEARLHFQAHPWLSLAPALAIGLTVIAVNLLGDAIRDISDPRLRNR